MDESGKRKVDGREELEQALKARERFLAEHPALRTLQDEIDRILANAGGPENRIKVLAFFIEKKLCELNDLIVDLKTSFKMQYSKVNLIDITVMLDNSQNSNGYLN